MPFEKGKSGNPSGKNGQKPISDALKGLLTRKPGKTLDTSVCETNAQLIAFNLMVKAFGGDKDSIKELLDRTEGRPAQSLEHSGMIASTHEELLKQLDSQPDDADGESDTSPA